MARFVLIVCTVVAVMLGGTVFTTPLALAQDVTPDAAVVTSLTLPAAGDPASCQVEPRAIEDYEALVGTPIPATPAVMTLTSGTPADQATVDAITATVLEASACFNAGAFRRLGGLYTDAGFMEDNAGMTTESLADFAAEPSALPSDEHVSVLDVAAVQLLPDGRVGAVVVYQLPSGQSAVDLMLFAKDGDRYLIDHWIDEPFDFVPAMSAAAEATPAA
jgi:hypothetical protein